MTTFYMSALRRSRDPRSVDDPRPLPTVSCLGGFGTPTPCPRDAAVTGRDPKTFTSGDIVRPFRLSRIEAQLPQSGANAEMVH